MNHIRIICNECGSDDVRFDAWAQWDEELQTMVLKNSFDYNCCDNCGNSNIAKEI